MSSIDMSKMGEVLRNFFTHKDFLPPPDQWPGTLFSPMQILFCAVVAVYIGFACVRCAKKSEAELKRIYFVLWLLMFVSEPLLAVWETYAAAVYHVEWNNVLPLWPCSIFLYAAPAAIFGKGILRKAGCGYICTVGLIGGLVNFVYPANYLSYYSCISMAGFRTIFYHGAMVFTGVTMLISGYHSFKDACKWQHLLIPALPVLLVSIPANIINFTVPGCDYMFFKLESFFFAPIGRATPDWLSVIVVYLLYLIAHAAPYVPAYIKNRKEMPFPKVSGL